MSSRKNAEFDEERFDEEMQEEENVGKRGRNRKRGGWKLILLLLVVFAIVAAAAFFDLNSFDSVRRFLNYNKVTQDENGKAHLFSYDTDRSNVFAELDNGLLVASNTRILLLNESGENVYDQAISMEHPAIAVGNHIAVVYNIGGTEVMIFDRSGCKRDMSRDVEGNIISISVNSKNYLTFVTESSGYKAAVNVYDDAGETLFTFRSSEHFVVNAFLGNDNHYLTVLMLDEEDDAFSTTAAVYALDATQSVASYSISGGLGIKTENVGNMLLTVSDNALTSANAKGVVLGTYEYEYPYLRGFSFGGSNFATLVLSRYRSGSMLQLTTVNSYGKKLASIDLDREVLDVSAAGHYIAVLYSNSLVIYTSDLEEYAVLNDTDYARNIEMHDDGAVLLLGSREAWLFIP